MTDTTSRVLALLSLLQTHRDWAGAHLAARLEVTERTLRRDIERVRSLGYRVDATRGTGGGYRLRAGERMPPLLLDPDEAVTMALGLRLAAERGLVDGADTSLSALAKLEQVLPAQLRARVAAVAGTVVPSVPGAAATAPGLIGELALVCRDRERVRFRYVSANGEQTSRVVEPHTVVAARRNWFLVGWDLQRADWRTFRVDRLSELHATRVTFAERELPTDAASFVDDATRVMHGEVELTVVLEMPLAAARVHFGHWARDATAEGPRRTRWRLRGSTIDELMSGLAWIPAEAAFSIDATPEVRARVADFGAALVDAAT